MDPQVHNDISQSQHDLYFMDSSFALKTALRECFIKKDGEPERLQLCYYAGQPIVSSQKNLIHLPINRFLPYFMEDENRIVPELLCLEKGILTENQIQELENTFNRLVQMVRDHRRRLPKKNNYPLISEDTLFENGDDAFQEALKQQPSLVYHPSISTLQICYTLSQPTITENLPANLIYVPQENLIHYFVTTSNRHPTRFVGDSRQDVQQGAYFQLAMVRIFEEVQEQRRRLIQQMLIQYKNLEPEFKGDKAYRIFFSVSMYSTVVLYSVRNLDKAFRMLGYATFINTEENRMKNLVKDISYIADYLNFHPNVVVHINDPINRHTHPDTIGVVWYQDFVAHLMAHTPVAWRPRDLVYASDASTAREVEKTGQDHCAVQFPCVDHWGIETEEHIPREEKVVFIGSSYTDRKSLIDSKNAQLYVNHMVHRIQEGYRFSMSKWVETFQQFDLEYFQAYKLFNGLVRHFIVRWMCESSPIAVEVYGAGWELEPDIKPFWKGALPHGSEVYRVYRSARYALEAQGTVLHTQRLAEMSLCGCIPVVYDSREFIEDSPNKWDNEILFFSTEAQLRHCLTSTPTGDPKKIGTEMTYLHFAKRLLRHFDSITGRLEGSLSRG